MGSGARSLSRAASIAAVAAAAPAREDRRAGTPAASALAAMRWYSAEKKYKDAAMDPSVNGHAGLRSPRTAVTNASDHGLIRDGGTGDGYCKRFVHEDDRAEAQSP